MKLETITRTPNNQTHKIPLLFIHGMWHGAWCWDEFFLPYFADAGWHVTAMSLRGHAGSEGRTRGSSIADYVKDVEQIAARFDTPPVVIGHSMGGFIAQKYLERNQAPAGVLVASVPYFGVWSSTVRVFMHNPLILLKAIAQWRMYPAVETPAIARWALFSKDMPEEDLLKYYAKLEDESFRAYLDLLGLNLAHPKRVKSPMLVLGGEEDKIISVNNVNATARAYNTQAELFPNMAHDMMLEKGWKDVAERMMRWLREKGM
jgi:pimeloyl-ACP methyl ester carboxylesterase